MMQLTWNQFVNYFKSNSVYMFTLQQIGAVHDKVKTGSDFPNYIKDLGILGVVNYETFVSDGHTLFMGRNDFKLVSEPKYDNLAIADVVNIERFKSDLKAHQKGETDYQTFCKDCAKSGVEKWLVCMETMTCTYFDAKGNELLQESIPQ